MSIEQDFERMRRGSIRLSIGGRIGQALGGARFGGAPDVPPEFAWPVYRDPDGGVERPLSFLAQFNCAELSALDHDGLLPKTGLLSFFYEADSQPWGYDPKHKGCARVFWFADAASLAPAGFPDALDGDFRFPALGIAAAAEENVPGAADYFIQRGKADREHFYKERERLGWEEPLECSKLLGWPNIIQNNMTAECELVSRGHYLGGGWETVTAEEKAAARWTSLDDWLLLFQLDMVEDGDFELMFGDSGRLYYYIRREDLLRRRFDRVWLMLQCC